MAYTTIFVAPGSTDAERRRATRAGPRAVASRRPQAALLGSAGFVDVDETDVTPAFAVTARGWLHQAEQHADVLASIESPGAFAEQQRDRRTMLAAIEDGLLRRSVLSARRP